MTHSTQRGTLTIDGHVHQNLYLPMGGRDVHAVLTLTAVSDEPRPGSAGGQAAEVIVLDGSGSMDVDMKRRRAIEAGTAAIEQIRDGVPFAVISGTHEATMLWPTVAELRVADAQSRAEATFALEGLSARGGTAIGQWLRKSRELLSAHPNALRHVTLVTDGRNEHETAEELDEAIRSCVGVLRCDCRGVGVDFDPAEIYHIAEMLQGSMGSIAVAAELPADFALIMSKAMKKAVELELVMWTPAQAVVRSLEQTSPSRARLTPHSSGTADGVDRYLLGAWGTEPRDYLVHIEIEPPHDDRARTDRPLRRGIPADSSTVVPAVRAERLAGRMSVAVRNPQPGDPELVQSYQQAQADGSTFAKDRGQIRALWTDDPVAPLVPNEKVAIVTERVGQADDLRASVVAWRNGDKAKVDKLLRSVRARAADTGDTELKDRLDRLYDAQSDTFRLGPRDEVEIFEESTMTTLLDR